MKHFSFLLLGIAAFTFAACKSSTGPKSATNSNAYATVTATINGQTFTSLFTGTDTSGSERAFFGANDSGEIDVAFSYLVSDTGTYAITDSLVGASYTKYSSPQVGYAVTHGTAHLSLATPLPYPTHIEGTFSFVAKDTKEDSVVITNGQFNFTY